MIGFIFNLSTRGRDLNCRLHHHQLRPQYCNFGATHDCGVNSIPQNFSMEPQPGINKSSASFIPLFIGKNKNKDSDFNLLLKMSMVMRARGI